MLVRSDHGGLAAQCLAIAQHCQPRRVLVVDLGPGGRGRSDPSLYDFVPEMRICEGYPDHDDIEWLCSGMACVFSVEGIYGERSLETLAWLGTRLVLQANPELFVPADLEAVNLCVVAPTDWRLDVLPPGTEVLPVPIDTVALAPEPRAPGLPRIGHMTGRAMLDRNGTLPLLAALNRLRSVEAEVWIANQVLTTRTRRDRRITQWRDVATYLERWQGPRPDLLVQPRRYGGLSLPTQEAAACGVPCVMTDLSPQRSWPLPLVPALEGRTHPMKGGQFYVAEPDVTALAVLLGELLADEALRAEWGERARAWAEELSWARWRSRYLALLLG